MAAFLMTLAGNDFELALALQRQDLRLLSQAHLSSGSALCQMASAPPIFCYRCVHALTAAHAFTAAHAHLHTSAAACCIWMPFELLLVSAATPGPLGAADNNVAVLAQALHSTTCLAGLMLTPALTLCSC